MNQEPKGAEIGQGRDGRVNRYMLLFAFSTMGWSFLGSIECIFLLLLFFLFLFSFLWSKHMCLLLYFFFSLFFLLLF